jgi:hypothetical protein
MMRRFKDYFLFAFAFLPYRCDCGRRFFTHRLFNWHYMDSWDA